MNTIDANPKEASRMLEAMSADNLIELANSLLAELRRKIDEPVQIKFGMEVSIEVRAHGDDDRVVVIAPGRGDTVVSYLEHGLQVRVRAQDEIGLITNVWLSNDDLVADPAGE